MQLSSNLQMASQRDAMHSITTIVLLVGVFLPAVSNAGEGKMRIWLTEKEFQNIKSTMESLRGGKFKKRKYESDYKHKDTPKNAGGGRRSARYIVTKDEYECVKPLLDRFRSDQTVWADIPETLIEDVNCALEQENLPELKESQRRTENDANTENGKVRCYKATREQMDVIAPLLSETTEGLYDKGTYLVDVLPRKLKGINYILRFRRLPELPIVSDEDTVCCEVSREQYDVIGEYPRMAKQKGLKLDGASDSKKVDSEFIPDQRSTSSANIRHTKYGQALDALKKAAQQNNDGKRPRSQSQHSIVVDIEDID